jgi:hypothetical protein
MVSSRFPSRDELAIGFSRADDRRADAFARRNTGLEHIDVRTLEARQRRAGAHGK